MLVNIKNYAPLVLMTWVLTLNAHANHEADNAVRDMKGIVDKSNANLLGVNVSVSHIRDGQDYLRRVSFSMPVKSGISDCLKVNKTILVQWADDRYNFKEERDYANSLEPKIVYELEVSDALFRSLTLFIEYELFEFDWEVARNLPSYELIRNCADRSRQLHRIDFRDFDSTQEELGSE